MSDSRQYRSQPRGTLAPVIENPDRCYQAAQGKDARFDGQFFCAVTSTGIYCRPSCPARTPKRENMRFYATAAAAQQAGFRACLRCRPDATPGSPEWNIRADVVARAMRLIRDGVVDREGVEGLAGRLGYSTRQLNRLLTTEVGTGPLALARAQRSQTARVLLETTDLPVTQVAFAAGFASVRQCNDTIRQTFADTPSGLRARAARTAEGRRTKRAPATQAIRLRLPCRQPFNPTSVLDFLGLRALPGVEALDGGSYTRSLRLPHGHGIVTLRAPQTKTEAESPDGPAYVEGELVLSDLRDLQTAVARCRQLLDLDADPVAIWEALRKDPLVGALVRRDPGRRVPGSADGFELAVRAVIGQQVSVSGARTVAGRLVLAAGEVLPAPLGTVTHLFPTPAALIALAESDPGAFSMPAGRRRAVVALAQAVDSGDVVIDPGADPAELRRSLVALPGIGPWTAEYVAMRALRDPDAFMPTDLGIRRGAVALGLPDDPAHLVAMTERWRPWRSYAMAHLWAMPATAAPQLPTRRTKGRAA
jgi:AraC family transcriptional regulator, regulatory protein of adaptative response / DNA-3-methyladenine glycosylase II